MGKNQITTAIIGINHLTASLGMGLRRYSSQPQNKLHFKVIGQDGDQAALKAARDLGALDEIQPNAREAVRGADVVITSLPAGVYAEVMEYLAAGLKAGAVVLDMSTNKSAAVELAAKCFPRNAAGSLQAYLVGVQPLVAVPHLFETRRDVHSASAQLFENSEMIIAPDAACPEEAVKLAADLAEILNMRPRFMTPDEYDGLADFTERLPLLLSMALFGTLQGSSGRTDLERSLNPTFALMVQNLRHFAGQDLVALISGHSENSLRRIDDLIALLTRLREMLASSDQAEIEAFLRELVMRFDAWQSRRRTGDWGDQLEVPDVTPMGVFSNLLMFRKPSKK